MKDLACNEPQNRDALGSWVNPDRHFESSLKDRWYRAIFNISSDIVFTTADFFRSRGMSAALMPVTTGSVTSPMGLGSDSHPVPVKIHGKDTFLADSMQFHLEYLLRLNPIGVYYIMPTFRGEDPDWRHLNEFFHIEAESSVGFGDNIEMVEDLIDAYARMVLDRHRDTVTSIVGGVDHLQQFSELVRLRAVPRVTFEEAQSALAGDPANFVLLNGAPISLTSVGERRLLDQMQRPVWLTHMPSVSVPFYQANSDRTGYSLCADLLMGIGEVAGTGTRHADADQTLAAMRMRHVDPQSYEWYLRLKREYPMTSSGFGIGVERLLLWILNHNDIRSAQIFIRQKGVDSSP